LIVYNEQFGVSYLQIKLQRKCFVKLSEQGKNLLLHRFRIQLADLRLDLENCGNGLFRFLQLANDVRVFVHPE